MALTDENQQRLADDLGADSLRYLPVEAISRAIGKPADHLCQACVTGHYPTKCGQHLYQIAIIVGSRWTASELMSSLQRQFPTVDPRFWRRVCLVCWSVEKQKGMDQQIRSEASAVTVYTVIFRRQRQSGVLQRPFKAKSQIKPGSLKRILKGDQKHLVGNLFCRASFITMTLKR